MHDLKNYLHSRFGKPVSEVSKTEFDNTVIEEDFEMICWDDAAKEFNKNNKEFVEEFSTADGLSIIEKEKNTQIFFFEFKNLDYSTKKDKQMAIFYLKKHLKQMKECPHDCKTYEDLEKISQYLTDKSNASLRSKPSDSLSLFYHIMKDYYHLDDNQACEKLFKTDKFFFLVSKTQAQYLPFNNKSNRKNNILKSLEFLRRFEPYHYKMVFVVNQGGFEKYFYKRNAEFLN